MKNKYTKKTENTSSIIKVIGVGGGGGNAVEHMMAQGIEGVDFAICNTDHQALDKSRIKTRIQLGPHLTEGRGAGAKPEIGKQACVESIEEIREYLSDGTKMLFITAGMGGGTGTGAAPIIAKAAKEMDILTVAIVTYPFKFEGMKRETHATMGLEELRKNVDAVLVISNEKVRKIHGNMKLSAAFAEADHILTVAAKGIAEIITIPGYMNVDFEDVNTVMRDSGSAMMSIGKATGPDRARNAIEAALNSPLLEDNDIRGAQNILLNITSGTDEVTMDEITEITDYIYEEAGTEIDVIWGNAQDNNLGDEIGVTIIATGFQDKNTKIKTQKEKPKYVPLEENDADEDLNLLDAYNQADNSHVVDFNMVSNTKDFISFPTEDKKVFDIDESEDDRFVNDIPRERQAEPVEPQVQNTKRSFQTTPNIENPKTITELEDTPAFKRRKVKLEEIDKSRMSRSRSRYTITDDLDKPIQGNNQFLHDNVD